MDIYSIRRVKGSKLLTVPPYILETLGIQEGEYVVFKGNKAKNEVTVKPLLTHGQNAAELKVLLKNTPGTNANIDSLLAKNGINIIFGKGAIVEEDLYSSVKLIDVTCCNVSLKELKKEIEGLSEVVDVTIEAV